MQCYAYNSNSYTTQFCFIYIQINNLGYHLCQENKQHTLNFSKLITAVLFSCMLVFNINIVPVLRPYNTTITRQRIAITLSEIYLRSNSIIGMENVNRQFVTGSRSRLVARLSGPITEARVEQTFIFTNGVKVFY